MDFQKEFRRRLREDLTAIKDELVSSAVEEYKQCVEAQLSEVVDDFLASVSCELMMQCDPITLRRDFVVEVKYRGERDATRDCGESLQDKQQE